MAVSVKINIPVSCKIYSLFDKISIMNKKPNRCPCGSNKSFSICCGRYLDGHEIPATAEALMRSRYTAYTLLRDTYLLTTWHPSTRPTTLNLLTTSAPPKWIGLEVKRYEQKDGKHATVEFIARYTMNGRAYRLHEVSRFVLEDGHWFYLNGELKNGTKA
jgi:SEC-C motif domain protein